MFKRKFIFILLCIVFPVITFASIGNVPPEFLPGRKLSESFEKYNIQKKIKQSSKYKEVSFKENILDWDDFDSAVIEYKDDVITSIYFDSNIIKKDKKGEKTLKLYHELKTALGSFKLISDIEDIYSLPKKKKFLKDLYNGKTTICSRFYDEKEKKYYTLEVRSLLKNSCYIRIEINDLGQLQSQAISKRTFNQLFYNQLTYCASFSELEKSQGPSDYSSLGVFPGLSQKKLVELYPDVRSKPVKKLTWVSLDIDRKDIKKVYVALENENVVGILIKSDTYQGLALEELKPYMDESMKFLSERLDLGVLNSYSKDSKFEWVLDIKDGLMQGEVYQNVSDVVSGFTEHGRKDRSMAAHSSDLETDEDKTDVVYYGIAKSLDYSMTGFVYARKTEFGSRYMYTALYLSEYESDVIYKMHNPSKTGKLLKAYLSGASTYTPQPKPVNINIPTM